MERKKYTSNYQRPGRNIEDKPRKKRVQSVNKNGIPSHGDRPAREKQYVIPYATYRG